MPKARMLRRDRQKQPQFFSAQHGRSMVERPSNVKACQILGDRVAWRILMVPPFGWRIVGQASSPALVFAGETPVSAAGTAAPLWWYCQDAPRVARIALALISWLRNFCGLFTVPA